jgi:ApbE superfamily uncharacterized protein (UPF0280 family)
MAGVAGAIAEFVGRDLLPFTDEIIVENGGDIFIYSSQDRVILIYAGEGSPFRDKMSIRVRGRDTPCGMCTSSKTIGHSTSFGNSDATVVIAGSAVTADVFATALGNIVKSHDDIDSAIRFAQRCTEIQGGVIFIGDRMAAWGDVEFA